MWKSFKPFFQYFTPYKKVFIGALLADVLYGLSSGAGIPVIFQTVLRKIFENENPYSLWTIFGIASLIPSIFILRGICGFLGSYGMNFCAVTTIQSLRKDLFTKLQRLPMSFFDRHLSGDLSNRLNTDTQQLQETLLTAASDCFRQPLQFLGALFALIYLSYSNQNALFLLIFLLALPLCFIPVRMIRKQLKHRGQQVQICLGKVSQTILENLEAMADIRSFCAEKAQEARFCSLLKDHVYNELKTIKYQKLQQPSQEIVVALFISGSFVYAYAQHLSFSTFSAMGLALYFAFEPIKRLTAIYNQMVRIQGAVERIQFILEQNEEQNATSLVTPSVTASDVHVEFKQVSFRYAAETVLKDFSLKIPSNQLYAIVGASGSGKSTLFKLLLRFYEPTEGEILIQGQDLKSFPLSQLRQQMTFVSQKPYLFHATVLQNLRLGNPQTSDEEVFEAAKNAFAENFILKLPEQYNTILGERGDTLSGGQKQRLALARAFLKKAPILLLDEATSALDSESEFNIQATLNHWRRQKTILLIAHRLSSIQMADKILLMDKGQLIAQGTHQELLQHPLYANYVKKQLLPA